jgi:hypothetical protein
MSGARQYAEGKNWFLTLLIRVVGLAVRLRCGKSIPYLSNSSGKHLPTLWTL